MSRYVSDIYAARYLGTRARQEDFVAGGSLASGGVFLILADGMGGHSDGNVASETAATAAAAALERGAAPVAAARAANHALAELKGKGSLAPNAGCTLIIATVHNGLCRWVSIGDSYLLCQKAGQQLERINPLHTYGARLDAMAGRGEISVEAAQSDPKRAALTSAVMGDDIEECSDGELMLDCGDRLILASDGYLTMGPELLGSFLSAHPAQGRGDAQMIATTILETVKRAGRPKQDNTSVVVYELAPAAPATPAAAPQSFPARRLIASACALILLLIGLIGGLLWNPTEDSGNVVLDSIPDSKNMRDIMVAQNERVTEQNSAQEGSSDKPTDTQHQQNADQANSIVEGLEPYIKELDLPDNSSIKVAYKDAKEHQNDDDALTKAKELAESVAKEYLKRAEKYKQDALLAVKDTKTARDEAKQKMAALVVSGKSAEETLTKVIKDSAYEANAKAQEVTNNRTDAETALKKAKEVRQLKGHESQQEKIAINIEDVSKIVQDAYFYAAKATIVVKLWESIREDQNKDIYASMSKSIDDVVKSIDDVVNNNPEEAMALQEACKELGILAVSDELSKVSKVNATKNDILRKYFEDHPDMLHPGLEVLLSKYIGMTEGKITIKGDKASLAFLTWLESQYGNDDKLQKCTKTLVSSLYNTIKGQDLDPSHYLPIYIAGNLEKAACSYHYNNNSFAGREKEPFKSFGDSVKALFIRDNSSK